MKYLNAHSICFVVGLGLTAFGAYGIYEPLAAVVTGVILMGIAAIGTERTIRR
jgi:hypothetical protein